MKRRGLTQKARKAKLLALWSELLSKKDYLSDQYHALLDVPELSLLVAKKLMEQAHPPTLLVVARKVPSLRRDILEVLVAKRGKFGIWDDSAQKAVVALLEFSETKNDAAQELLEGKNYCCHRELLWKIVHEVPALRQRALERMVKKEEDLDILFKDFPHLRPMIWRKALRTHETVAPGCKFPRTDLLKMIMKVGPQSFRQRAWKILFNLCNSQKEKGWPVHFVTGFLKDVVEYVPQFRLQAANLLLDRDEEFTHLVHYVPEMREQVIDKIIARERTKPYYGKYTLRWLLQFCSPRQKEEVEKLREITSEEILEEILVTAGILSSRS